jgi:sugar phosphate isomerase/epimerase
MAGLREALELVADRAARSGVRAAFEFLGFPDCPVNTPAQAAELVARKLVDMLRSQGYSGPWSLETFNPTYWTEDPAEVAGRGLAATKGVLSLG